MKLVKTQVANVKAARNDTCTWKRTRRCAVTGRAKSPQELVVIKISRTGSIRGIGSAGGRCKAILDRSERSHAEESVKVKV